MSHIVSFFGSAIGVLIGILIFLSILGFSVHALVFMNRSSASNCRDIEWLWIGLDTFGFKNKEFKGSDYQNYEADLQDKKYDQQHCL